ISERQRLESDLGLAFAIECFINHAHAAGADAAHDHEPLGAGKFLGKIPAHCLRSLMDTAIGGRALLRYSHSVACQRISAACGSAPAETFGERKAASGTYEDSRIDNRRKS